MHPARAGHLLEEFLDIGAMFELLDESLESNKIKLAFLFDVGSLVKFEVQSAHTSDP